MVRTAAWPCLLAVALALWHGPARAEITEVIARVKPSVVIVGTWRASDSPRFRMRGTGFVVGDGNLAVTAAHVVAGLLDGASDNPSELSVMLPVRAAGADFKRRRAVVLEVDLLHDLALLRFEGEAAPPLSIRDSVLVREGQSVAFMGFPIGGMLGFSAVTHRGMISSITQSVLPAQTARLLNEAVVRGLRTGAFDLFQLDATAYPGNSGSPLFDPVQGDLLGVLSMALIKGTRESALSQPSGISYAIPSRFVAELIERARGK